MNLKQTNESVLTPWSRFPLVKLISDKVSNKLPVFYETDLIITFTRARYCR